MDFSAQPPEVLYGLLVIGLFIVPRILQRFRLPAAIVALSLGALAGIRFDLFHGDATIQLFALFGIVGLFLFAGLEVDFKELRENVGVLGQHIAVQVLLLIVVATTVQQLFGLTTRAALLFALALLTPSTGFILDSLPGYGLSAGDRFWVRSKAIATELIALGILFLIVQSTSATKLSLSALAIVAMIGVLPVVFRVFATWIAPYAPNTEFTFLILVALVCAFITRRLGVYYLVGAFVVGLSALRLRRELPSLSSEKLLTGIEMFASFFIPFYFFKAGVGLEADYFTGRAIVIGVILFVVVVPLRIGSVAAHRRLAMGESWEKGMRVGIAIVPTLVFSLVIGAILHDRFAISAELSGALIVYTLLNTVVPGFFLRTPLSIVDDPLEAGRDSAAMSLGQS